MSRGLSVLTLVALGVAVGGGASWIVAGGRGDGRDDLLRDLASRQAERLGDVAGSAAAGAETTRAVAMSQFYRLQEFRRLGEEGQAVAWVVPIPAGRETDPIAAAAGGASIRIPRIALDPGARDTWAREVGRLSGLEGTIDARIFETFVQVRGFIDEHPWPLAPGLSGVRGSEWASPDVTEQWLSLNRTLVSRVDALIAGL
ncbi:MAG: hypothetical protein ACC682_09435 [Gemmatimonadota bacterium]